MRKISEFFLPPDPNPRPNSPAKDEVARTYYERNRLWLNSLVGAAVLALLIEMYNSVLADPAPMFPTWIQEAVLILGAFAGGLGTVRTDTLSAHIVQGFGIAAGIALALRYLFM